MPALNRPEPHAITRLRERFEIELSRSQLHWLCILLSDPVARRDPRWFRLLWKQPDGNERWYVNLEKYAGKPLWAKAVYNPTRKRLVTFLKDREVGYPGWRRRVDQQQARTGV